MDGEGRKKKTGTAAGLQGVAKKKRGRRNGKGGREAKEESRGKPATPERQGKTTGERTWKKKRTKEVEGKKNANQDRKRNVTAQDVCRLSMSGEW
jgi:hypothetical protein